MEGGFHILKKCPIGIEGSPRLRPHRLLPVHAPATGLRDMRLPGVADSSRWRWRRPQTITMTRTSRGTLLMSILCLRTSICLSSSGISRSSISSITTGRSSTRRSPTTSLSNIRSSMRSCLLYSLG